MTPPLAIQAGESPWIVVSPRVTRPRMRLFCFHHAGGSAAGYRTWPKDLPPDIEVCAVQLPGRGTRFGEAPFTRLGPLLDALEQPLAPLLDVPFALFGHSMGALIAFELARRLRRRDGPRPVHLFVAAHEAPQIVSSEPVAHVLPDPLFLAELRRYGGLPPSVVLEPDLLELFLPIVRADFEVLETWSHTPEEPLDIPISAFGGLTDAMNPPDQIEAWRVQTRSDFTQRMFPGDHFFLQSDRTALLSHLSQALT